MLTLDSIVDVVEDYLKYDTNRVLCNWAACGGWERWFQGELNWKFSREVDIVETEIYPQTNNNVNLERVDITLEDESQGIIYIELKCLSFTKVLNNNAGNFIAGVIADWKKLYHMQHTKYSLVMIPNDIDGNGYRITETLLNYAKQNNIRGLIKLCGGINYSRHQIRYINSYMYVCLFEISSNNLKILNL